MIPAPGLLASARPLSFASSKTVHPGPPAMNGIGGTGRATCLLQAVRQSDQIQEPAAIFAPGQGRPLHSEHLTLASNALRMSMVIYGMR